MAEDSIFDDLKRQIERIDEQVEQITKNVEAISRDLAGRTEDAVRKIRRRDDENGGRVFFGLALIAAGVVWMANKLGWFNVSLPMLPLAMIVVGLYLLISASRGK